MSACWRVRGLDCLLAKVGQVLCLFILLLMCWYSGIHVDLHQNGTEIPLTGGLVFSGIVIQFSRWWFLPPVLHPGAL
jgi:hypothetical protein